MGYYTNFHLEMNDTRIPKVMESVIDSETNVDLYTAIKKKFAEVFGYDVLDDLCDFTYDWKWYDWENDMRELAKEFPYVRFSLEGRGEEREDWWIATFLGERFQHRCAKIIPPDAEPEEF